MASGIYKQKAGSPSVRSHPEPFRWVGRAASGSIVPWLRGTRHKASGLVKTCIEKEIVP
jgi:hypothetical protein